MKKIILLFIMAFILISPMASYAMSAIVVAVNPDKIVVEMDKGSYVAGILIDRAAVYEGDIMTNVQDNSGIQFWKDKDTGTEFPVYVEDAWVSQDTALEYFYTPSLLSK